MLRLFLAAVVVAVLVAPAAASASITPKQIEGKIVKGMESKPGRTILRKKISPPDRPHMLLVKASITKQGDVATLVGKKNGYLSNVQITDYTAQRKTLVKTWVGPGYSVLPYVNQPETSYGDDLAALANTVIKTTGRTATSFGTPMSITATKTGKTWSKAVANFARVSTTKSIHTVTLNLRGKVVSIKRYGSLYANNGAIGTGSAPAIVATVLIVALVGPFSIFLHCATAIPAPSWLMPEAARVVLTFFEN